MECVDLFHQFIKEPNEPIFRKLLKCNPTHLFYSAKLGAFQEMPEARNKDSYISSGKIPGIILLYAVVYL